MNLTIGLQLAKWMSSIFVACVVTCSVGVAGEEEQPSQSEDASVDTFVVLDSVDAWDAYQSERHEETVEALATTSLSQEHKELLANALGKMYLGVPVST